VDIHAVLETQTLTAQRCWCSPPCSLLRH